MIMTEMGSLHAANMVANSSNTAYEVEIIDRDKMIPDCISTNMTEHFYKISTSWK